MSPSSDTFRDLIDWVREQLIHERETDPAKKILFSTIIPGAKNPLVVSTSNLDACVRILWMRTKNTPDQFFSLCQQLWADQIYYEEFKVAIRLLRKMVRKDPDRVINLVQTWKHDLHTWDLTDQLGMYCSGECLVRDFDRYIPIIQEWGRSNHVWVIRLALSSLVKLRSTTLTIAQWNQVQLALDHLWGNFDHYIVKGLSWALRELSKSNELAVIRYLEEKLNQKALPKEYGRKFVVDSCKKIAPEIQTRILRMV